MTQLRMALRARTTHRNSMASDVCAEVPHDVEVGSRGGAVETVRLMATDPLDAMQRVQNMSATEYEQLPRG